MATTIKKRSRQKPTTKSTPVSCGYAGPSLDDILKLSEQQVQVSFDELGVEPSPFHWSEEDEQVNRSAWHSFGRLDMSEPQVPIQQLHTTARAIHEANLRTDLLGAYLKQWVDSLETDALIDQVQQLSEIHMSESERRYAKRADLQQRVLELVWPRLVKASTLYVQPESPLAGGGK